MRTDRLQENPDLFVFIPLLYVVWSDSILSPTESKTLQSLIEGQSWLTREDKAWLLQKTDPASPPSAEELRQWFGEVQQLKMETGDRQTLVELGARIAERYRDGKSAPKIDHKALQRMEDSTGSISREAVYQFWPEARQTRTAGQFTQSSFDLEAMSRILDGDNVAINNRMRKLISQPAFNRIETGDLAVHRQKVLDWCYTLASEGLGAIAYPKAYGGQDDMGSYFAVMEALSYHDLSLVVKFGVQFGLFGMSVFFLGTEKHHRKYLKQIGTLELPGCFAMTETGHGSNVKGIETTATYNHTKREFVIHTPNEAARKEYIGNAALHGRMATVFAKLIIDGKDFGVTAFLVPIRDMSGRTLPGVTIKDCGRKMGLNGVDNGVIYFDNVVIPHENMLDRFASVSDAGKFESPIASDNRRFFTMLGTLVGGRIGIPRSAVSASKVGLATAILYGDKRRQFGPDGGAEIPILNYQTHQRRLMPLLANTYALHFALQYLTQRFLNRKEDEMQEIEAIAAGLKAFATWNATATLQECRECCGGKGYLTENRLDDLKNDTEIYTTFEGDNTVLMQLVAKSRLSEFKQQFSNINMFGMLNYIATLAKTSVQEKNPFAIRNTENEHLLDPEFHLQAFQYREKSILSSAARRLKALIDAGQDSFDAFNDCQHHLVQVGFAYIERIVLEQFRLAVDNTPDPSCREALNKLCRLFALSQLEKNKGWYLESGYMEGVKTKAIRKLVDHHCEEVRKEAVPLVRAFAIPENCLAEIVK